MSTKLFQVGRIQKIKRRNDNIHQISCGEKPVPLDQRPGKQGRRDGREHIITIVFEHKGMIVV
jgi:hypothetical protein